MTPPSQDDGGWSTCPICGKRWLVTTEEDCFMPRCGCYGTDSSAANPRRPCEPCGLIHVGMGDKPFIVHPTSGAELDAEAIGRLVAASPPFTPAQIADAAELAARLDAQMQLCTGCMDWLDPEDDFAQGSRMCHMCVRAGRS